MKIKISCLYCGYIELRTVSADTTRESLCCVKCRDKHTKIQEIEASKIDYYAGSPPFRGDKPFLYGEDK